jgi:UDP-N-acetylmuramoyl-tripeptide--D-alanyl-D-alanine ligase
VVDDTYNANPDSVHAAIDTLLALPAPHTLVLGDMGEVGEQGLAFHQEVVERALQHASVHVISTGQWLTQAHQAHAQPHGQWAHASNVQQAIDWALPRAAQGGSILIKGSRFMRMEQVVQALQQQWPMADNLETTTC